MRKGATLVELTAVILIIAILVALLIPGVFAARERARCMYCQNNLRQQGLALLSFQSSNLRLPAGRDAKDHHQHSWMTAILPYVEESKLYDRFDARSHWNQGKNQGLATSDVRLYQCPATVHLAKGLGDYGGNYGTTLTGLLPGFGERSGWNSGTLLTLNLPGSKTRAISTSDIKDGSSNTFLVVEDAGFEAGNGDSAGFWANGNHCVAHDEGPINRSRSLEIYSDHSGGANVLMSDGSVKFLRDTVEESIIGALCTRDQKEIVHHAEFN